MIEDSALLLAVAGATIVCMVDTVSRALATGFYVPGGAAYMKQFTLWMAFVGGLIATREKKHLVLSTSQIVKNPRARRFGEMAACCLSAGVSAILAVAAFEVVKVNQIQEEILPGGIPVWISECVMPLSLLLMTLRFIFQASSSINGRIFGLIFVGAAFSLGWFPDAVADHVTEISIAIGVFLLLGAPVFVGVAAIALLFFFADGVPVTAVSAEVYRLIASPTIPAIPLLTAAGYILAESSASTRLLRFFRALFGWFPGGLAVVVTAVCALFTSFTGGSGITILALGGLVYPILREDGYPEGFSLGLITAAGSLGLLFPPSLPVILYSVVATSPGNSVPAGDMYIAGLLPGLILVGLVAAWAVYIGRKSSRPRDRFTFRELFASAWLAKWELGLPIFVIALFASGVTSMVETAAAAVAYSIVVECAITRDIKFFTQLPGVIVKAAALAGAVLILLSAAMGATSYMVDAMIPDLIFEWVQEHISTQIGFLLALNVLLLVVGCFVDIFSATIILAPLIVPLGAAYGVDPVHQGIIFLANLELGFLTPPIGLNLFLASSRFDKPILKIYRYALPFLLIRAGGVLLITYIPALSIGVLGFFGRT